MKKELAILRNELTKNIDLVENLKKACSEDNKNIKDFQELKELEAAYKKVLSLIPGIKHSIKILEILNYNINKTISDEL